MVEDPYLSTEEEEEGTPGWMVTYGDMVTLLLVFFVLLFSFAVVDSLRFEHAIKSLKGALGVITMEQSILDKGETPMNKILSGAMDLVELDDFLKEFKEYVQENNLENIAEATFNEQGVVISLTDMVIFNKGTAAINPAGVKSLRSIQKFVESFPYDIQVVGHADKDRIRTRKYPSNWELSFDRALQVARFYQKGNPDLKKKLSVTAFGANRPLVLGGQEIKPELSRRVDIIFRRPDIAEKEAKKG